MDVSVCIPTHNEPALRDTVLEMQQAMEETDYEYEIIVLDDGSQEGHVDSITDLENIRIIRHKRNYGGGVARVTAMKYARGQIILQTDADGTYPVDEVGAMLAKMENADMVVGARRIESATDWRFLRILMKWILRKVASVLCRHDIPDLNSGMRCYDRRLALQYEHLYPRGHSIMSTMTIAFLTQGYRVEFHEIDYRVRVGKSSFHPIGDTYNYLVTIVRTIANFDPLRLFLPIILLLCVAATINTIRDFVLFHQLGNLSPVLWLSALLIFVIAILSDQLSRIANQNAKITNSNIVSEDDVVVIADPGVGEDDS